MKSAREDTKGHDGQGTSPHNAACIVALGEDSLLRLRIQPRSSKTRIVGMLDGRLKIALAAPPVDGKANRELVAFLAKRLGLGKTAIDIVKGQNSRMKSVRIRDLDADSVLKLL